jgi:hypothetical protein
VTRGTKPLPEFGVRDFGTIVPGDRAAAPDTVPPPAPPAARARDMEPVGPAQPILAADKASETDRLGLGAPLAVLAELVLHRQAETPFAIGLLGLPGTGKSSALCLLVRAITAARGAPRTGSGAGSVFVVEIDAIRLDGPAVVALADAVHASLAGTYPALVSEAIHASGDPGLAAREAFEALDGARRKLSGERLALETEEARRAGLTESVLFETAGTRIDAYARAHRGRLKSRLAGLGVDGDPIRAFKQLVHRACDGGAAKILFVLRSFWAFKGQATLVVLAVLLLLAGVGLGTAEAERAAWLGWLRDTDSTRAAADWLEANIGLLATLRQFLFIGAGLAIATNLLRALRLIVPVLRASALLKEDLALRRRQADVEFGHEIRRVETLAAEVDALASRAAEAERRAAEDRQGNGPLAEASPFLDDPRKRRAERFVAAVGRLVADAGRSRLDAKGRPIELPSRIVIALDGLDAVDPSRARDILAAAHAAFGAGFVLLVAADAARLKAADGRLESWIQVPFQVGAFFARADAAALVQAMLDPKPGESTLEAARANSRSVERDASGKPVSGFPHPALVALDERITEAEASLLRKLAALAGHSPRAVKRFVNLYRLARTLCPDHKGMLALMLALDAGGTEAEIEAVHEALGSTEARLDLDHLGAGARLSGALASVRSLMGDESLTGARRAAETARLFSFGPAR